MRGGSAREEDRINGEWGPAFGDERRESTDQPTGGADEGRRRNAGPHRDDRENYAAGLSGVIRNVRSRRQFSHMCGIVSDRWA